MLQANVANSQNRRPARNSRPLRARYARRFLSIFAAATVGLPLLTGCDEETARREFISASTAGLETGVRAIVGGMIDGTFAVVDIATAEDASGDPDGTVAENTTSTTDTGDSAASARR